MKKIIPWGLILARLKQTSTAEQEALFHQWIAEESHAALFREIEAVWEEIRCEVAEAKPDVAASWKKMEMRLQRGRRKQTVFRRLVYPLLAAAAVLLLVIGLSYRYQDDQVRSKQQVYAALSGKSKILLPDSSVVWLNAGTTLRYASSFARDRQVQVEGEASFEVTPDKEHPFVVSTGGIKVKVHGTCFNVNSYASAENIKVALTRGSVSILLENGTESFLQPGEMATLDKKSRRLEIEKTDIHLETFWASEQVTFRNQSLGYICRHLEKWYHIRIEVDPAIADSLHYTFTIKDDSIETILRVMARITPISYTFDENNHLRIRSVQPEK